MTKLLRTAIFLFSMQLIARAPAVEPSYTVEVREPGEQEKMFLAPSKTEGRSDHYFFWAILGLMPAVFWAHTLWLKNRRIDHLKELETSSQNVVQFPTSKNQHASQEDETKKAS